LKNLLEKYKLDKNPALNVSREDIESAVSKMVGNTDNSDSASN
jgi:hypothetical protein